LRWRKSILRSSSNRLGCKKQKTNLPDDKKFLGFFKGVLGTAQKHHEEKRERDNQNYLVEL
jgi:hypothetical protein